MVNDPVRKKRIGEIVGNLIGATIGLLLVIIMLAQNYNICSGREGELKRIRLAVGVRNE